MNQYAAINMIFIIGGLGATEIIILLMPLLFLIILMTASVAFFLIRKKKQNVRTKKCPHCAETIKAEARACKFCYRDV
jgi:hypothetical protein